MGYMPVIRVLAPLLGEINSGSLRTKKNRPVSYIVPCLGDTISPMAPVNNADRLGVAVDAAVS